MPPTWASPPKDQTTPAPMHANPDTKSDVDSIILDYLVCLAIDSIFVAIENLAQNDSHRNDDDDVSWQVDTVRGLYSSLVPSELESPLAEDLGIKFGILTAADQLRHATTTRTDQSREQRVPISQTGMMFVQLCSAASSKISESRFFDALARFIIQAIIEDQSEGRQPSKYLTELCSWAPEDPAQRSKWTAIRQRYVDELDLGSPRATQKAVQQYPLLEFITILTTFLRDLMTTLDPPVLIQLERGKLGDLTREDTQDLKNLVGLR
ncbi:hypothetical protein N7478_012656 [Penicillium angulare]|uniref:uncharacterized protein n=1 Tax=Penicillium angulare TaxID=116970 RepID=UPI00254132DE|nr:uncharacterized protein N7478_012656 [Penicillium angulare]KAJ5256552.1 hypothetical protein N7478_012656 [Penicillium angulare]